MKVELFIPCFIDQVYPQTAFNTVKVLEQLGCEVIYNPQQTCCGQPAFNSGFWDEAKEVGQKFLNDFSEEHYIVCPSASCTGMVKNYYTDLFLNASSHNKCRTVQQHMHELSEFIVNVLKVENLGAALKGRAVYHSSCASLRECNIREEPLKLLRQVEGLELVDLPHADACCGFGGTFAVKFEPISTAMAEQKLTYVMECEAEYIISTDVSCLMHLQGYIDKHHLPLKTLHIADVLSNAKVQV